MELYIEETRVCMIGVWNYGTVYSKDIWDTKQRLNSVTGWAKLEQCSYNCHDLLSKVHTVSTFVPARQ